MCFNELRGINFDVLIIIIFVDGIMVFLLGLDIYDYNF